jgi:hypothetical protein
MRDNSVLVLKDGVLASVPASDPLASATVAQFKVVDRQLGRVSLQSVADGRMLSVGENSLNGPVSLKPTIVDDAAQTFQWIEMPRGDLLLLSLASNRNLRISSGDGAITADAPGAQADRENGASFDWRDLTAPSSSSASGRP